MPSSGKACQAMFQLIEDTGSGAIVDLGSGWGTLVVRIALKYPNRKIIGYEVSIVPWLMTIALKKAFGLKNLEVYRQDFLTADLGNVSVIICYLFPAAMNAIKDKLASEPNNINYLISNCFAFPSGEPDKTIQLNDFYKSKIYRYRINLLEARA